MRRVIDQVQDACEPVAPGTAEIGIAAAVAEADVRRPDELLFVADWNEGEAFGRIDDAPCCVRCCAAMGITYRTRMGFGRSERWQARDKALDRLIAKVETSERLRFKPAPANWGGKCQLVYRSRSLTWSMRRRLIELRLNQLLSQQASSLAKDGDTIRTYQPSQAAKQLVDTKPIWRARTSEALQQALDDVQSTIFAALSSDDPRQRLNAAKLMLRTKQARERGF